MKNIILKIIFTSVFLIVNTRVSCFANPDSDAKNYVNQTMASAREDALMLVKNDFNNATISVLEANENLAKLMDSKKYTDILISLEDNLSQIIEADNKDISQSESAIIDLLEKYQKTVRDRFAASFYQSDLRFREQQFLVNLKNIYKSMTEQCKMGHSDINLNYTSNPLPNIPPPVNQISFTFSDNGAVEFNFQSAISTGSQESKNRQALRTITTESTNIDVSIAVGSSTMAVGALAAMPYFVAAMIAVALVTDALDAEEQAKLQNQIVEANLFKFDHVPTNKDESQFYRESCQNGLDLFSKLINGLESYQTSNDFKNKLDSDLANGKTTLKNYESAASQKINDLFSLKLKLLIENSNCPMEDKTNNIKCREDNDNYILTLDDKNPIAVNLPKDENKRKDLIDAIKKRMVEFSQSYPPDKIIQYSLWEAVDTLNILDQKIYDSLQILSSSSVDELQQRVFNKILEILALHRKMIQNISTSVNTIELEENEILQFNKMKAQLKILVGHAIHDIFEKTNHDDLLLNSKDFYNTAIQFVKDHYFNSEVRSFGTTIEAYRKFYETL